MFKILPQQPKNQTHVSTLYLDQLRILGTKMNHCHTNCVSKISTPQAIGQEA